MANTAQARKRARQAEKKRLHNSGQRSTMRTGIKSFIKAIDAGDKSAAQEAYKASVSVIDKAITKGLVHKNKAARHKSRLNNHLRSL